MAKRLFQQSLSDHCVGRSLSLKRSWRTVPVARYLTNVSVCFIQLSKSCGESVLLSCKSRGRAGKRGLNKSCSAVTACYSSVSKGISKSKIILISASLIRPFNSMSTTMQTLPYLSRTDANNILICTGHTTPVSFQSHLRCRPQPTK